MKVTLRNKTIIASLALAISLSGLTPAVFADETSTTATQSNLPDSTTTTTATQTTNTLDSSTPTNSQTVTAQNLTNVAVTQNLTMTTQTQTGQEISKIISYYKGQGVVTNEWAAFGLNALGEDINQSPYSADQDKFINHITSSPTSMGAWAKSIFAILSAGENPKNFNGKDYVASMLSSKLDWVNNACYGLMALDATEGANNADPTIAAKRSELINFILTNNRLQDKGWSWDNQNLDPDLTALALIALAPHKDETVSNLSINTVINQAVSALSAIQQDDGGFSSWGVNNCSSLAEVIQALTALGIDPEGTDFTKSGGNAVSKFLSFQMENGEFHNDMTDSGDGAFATPGGLEALASLKQYFEIGKSDIYLNVSYHHSQSGTNTLFSISDASIDRTQGLKATVTISPTNGGHAGNEVVLFELMDGQTPKGIVAVEKDITASEKVTAYFNQNSSTAKIKVFVLDTFPSDPTVIGNILAEPYTLQ
jgi:hypothetical protein